MCSNPSTSILAHLSSGTNIEIILYYFKMLIFAYIWRKRAQMGKKNFFKAWIRKIFNFKQTLKRYSIVCKQ
jgi:hypothetical protein